MTAAEAIQKEIDREKEELDGLDKEEKRLSDALAQNPPNPRALVEQLLEVLKKILHKKDFEEEIEGKKKALAAVTAHPDTPLAAIDEEIAREEKQAAEVGRKAQDLREKAYREQKEGQAEQAKADRADAKKLSDEFDLELARLRGKHEARRAVQHAKQQ